MDKQQRANPCGLDGFAFLEFSAPDPLLLYNQFRQMGFQRTAIHKTKDICLYRQGNITFIVNNVAGSQATIHATQHGAGACAMGFYVADAKVALDHAVRNGARSFYDPLNHEHGLAGIEGIGGSVIYFVERHRQSFYHDWQYPENQDMNAEENCGLEAIDHLTHNVLQGNMDKWADFYARIFNFYEIRYFDIKGQLTGLVSRALSSPCGKIKIPLNESKDDKSQIEEFLKDYHGEGIQHIALSTNDIYNTVSDLRINGVKFLDVPNTYYEMLYNRIPWHQEPLDELAKRHILVDGEQDPKHGLLLQIFTENVFGPVFFEIIQRRGNEGFGEGNFTALFEAIERDQLRRGVL